MPTWFWILIATTFAPVGLIWYLVYCRSIVELGKPEGGYAWLAIAPFSLLLCCVLCAVSFSSAVYVLVGATP